MSVVTQSLTASLSQATASRITNITMGVATEVSHSLTNKLKTLIIKSRGNSTIQLTFVPGESGTKFLTISKYSALALDSIDFTGKTLYLQTDKADTVEVFELY